MSPIVGIDLGTTHSLVAICDDAGPRVLLDEQGRALLPSVVRFLEAGKTTVGWQAKNEAAQFTDSTIASSKRFMGRGLVESLAMAEQMSTLLKEGPRGLAAFNVRGAAITPQEVAAVVLAELRRIAEARLQTQVTRAVITVPAYFDDAQRQATRDAARLCGLTVERIVNEPTAAALAYGIGRTHKSVSPNKNPALDGAATSAGDASQTAANTNGETVAVYDLGGGTFDISILRIEAMDAANPTMGDAFQVLSTRGDTRLGGDDFDQLIAQWAQTEIKNEFNISQFTASDMTAIRMLAEHAKRALSEHEETAIEIQFDSRMTLQSCAVIDARAPSTATAPFTENKSTLSTSSSTTTPTHPNRVLRRTLTRAHFQNMIAPLIARTLDAFTRARADAGNMAGNIKIDRVVLVGGSTRIPYVRAQVAAHTGLTPYTALDPDQVVALGAAVQASILAGGRTDLLLLDVIPLSLGIETQGGAFAKLIVRNSAIPSRATEMFTTSKDNQTGVLIHVAQGEREMVSDCRSIARFELRGLPAMPAGIPQVEVEFLVDANGVLNVSAVERRSGMRAAIQAAPSYGLTSAEVERMERDSVTHARSDMHRHRVTDLAVNARLDVKWIGEALARTHAALEPAYVQELQEMLRQIELMCAQAETDPMAANADALHKAKEQLDRQSVHLHETSIAKSLREMRVTATPKTTS
jgi:molecular chaperone DnaK (HSP70)